MCLVCRILGRVGIDTVDGVDVGFGSDDWLQMRKESGPISESTYTEKPTRKGQI
jgi:hypothetical protein